MKSVFFGSPNFSIPSLQAVIKNTNCVAIITKPDKPRGRGQKILPTEVKKIAIKENIPCFSPSSLKKESIELENMLDFFAKDQIDLFMVTAYGNILPQSILDIPKIGCFNVHGSLLPKYRGAAPIQRAIEDGLNLSGICLQKMILQMDAGDIISEIKIPILDQDNSISYAEKLSSASFDLVEEFIIKIKDNKEPLFTKQDESQISHAPKISKQEAIWKKDWNAIKTHNKTRAFIAWPKVDFILDQNISFKLIQTKVADTRASLSSGEILLTSDKKCLLSCGENTTIELLIIKPTGKAELNAYDFLLSHHSNQPSIKKEKS